jgi:phage antirepressor YoqD-like protein
MSNLKIYNYEGFPIQFDIVEGKIMANAASMCDAFQARANDWLSLKRTKRYIEAITRKTVLAEKELVIVSNGGSNPGTWIHERLIINLARWLDVDFEIWCDEKIAELLRTGSVELPKKSEAEQILDVIRLLEVKVEQAKAEKEQVVKQLEVAQPKVEYFDKVINAEGLFPIGKIAQQLNMSAKRLNDILKEKKVQRRVNGTWVLTAAYLNKGYANLKTHPFTDVNGVPRTAHHLQWTEKGKHFIFELLGVVKTAA